MFLQRLHWYTVVNTFVERNIKYEQDKLPAFSGLAETMQVYTGFSYHAGLWREDMHRGLLWSGYHAGIRPRAYIAPSRSWVSLAYTKSPHSRVLYYDVWFWRNYIDTANTEVLDIQL